MFVRKGQEVVITPPNTFTVPRDDRAYPPVRQPRVHERAPADVDAQTAPSPVPYSSFNGYGRQTSARWIDQVLAIGDKLSIRASEVNGSGLVQRIPGAVVVRRNALGSVPLTERADIEAPAQTTYGALATLYPALLTSRPYAKLGG